MALVWNELMRGTQSDQPQPKQSASRLKHQLGSRPGVNRLRRLGPSRASDNFDIMAADAARESKLLGGVAGQLQHVRLSEQCLSSAFAVS